MITKQRTSDAKQEAHDPSDKGAYDECLPVPVGHDARATIIGGGDAHGGIEELTIAQVGPNA